MVEATEWQRSVSLRRAGISKGMDQRLWREAGIRNVGDFIDATDGQLDAVFSVGRSRIDEMRRRVMEFVERTQPPAPPPPPDPAILSRPILPALREAADSLGGNVGRAARADFLLDSDEATSQAARARFLGLTKGIYERASWTARSRFPYHPVARLLHGRMREVAEVVARGRTHPFRIDYLGKRSPDTASIWFPGAAECEAALEAMWAEPWADGVGPRCMAILLDRVGRVDIESRDPEDLSVAHLPGSRRLWWMP